MALKRELSLGVGLATAALVWGIYNGALPTVADMRAGTPHDQDAASSERVATWTAAAAVAGVSLIAKDPTVFVLGGTMVVVLAWTHRHANHYDSGMRQAMVPSSRQVMQPTNDAGYTPSAG